MPAKRPSICKPESELFDAANIIIRQKRGRKVDETLPKSHQREVQRNFRARRSQHLLDLERRVEVLERENLILRQLAGVRPASREPLGRGPTGCDFTRPLIATEDDREIEIDIYDHPDYPQLHQQQQQQTSSPSSYDPSGPAAVHLPASTTPTTSSAAIVDLHSHVHATFSAPSQQQPLHYHSAGSHQDTEVVAHLPTYLPASAAQMSVGVHGQVSYDLSAVHYDYTPAVPTSLGLSESSNAAATSASTATTAGSTAPAPYGYGSHATNGLLGSKHLSSITIPNMSSVTEHSLPTPTAYVHRPLANTTPATATQTAPGAYHPAYAVSAPSYSTIPGGLSAQHPQQHYLHSYQ